MCTRDGEVLSISISGLNLIQRLRGRERERERERGRGRGRGRGQVDRELIDNKTSNKG